MARRGAAAFAGPVPARTRNIETRTIMPASATGATLQRATNLNAAYEAGAQSRRTLKWRPASSAPNASILPALTTLRDRSRQAIRNDGYAKGAIDRLVTNIIGTGITPLSQADDPEFRRAITALWIRWTDESDADGLLDWYGQQSQSCRAWLEGGETLLRLRPRLLKDGLSVPLQLQVLEPEFCPHDYYQTLASGNQIRAGIEFNGIGRRVAYWLYTSRPGEFQDINSTQLQRVSADFIIPLYDPLRPGQLRGVPHLTQALIRLMELDKFDDATLLRQQLANLFVAFLKRPTPTSSSESHPLTGLPVETTADDKPLLSLEPGIFQELDPGEEVDFSEPPSVDGGYKDFTKQQLMHAAAAAGVPYETLTGDMSGVNDRTVRVILQEFRRRITAWQHQIYAFQVCRRVWRYWMDQVYLSGVIPMPGYETNPDAWTRVKWMPQAWPYLHPVQDVEAKRMSVRAGFETRSDVVSEQGEDAEQIDARQKADNDRADGLGLKYESDGRQPLNAGKQQASAPVGEPSSAPAAE